VLLLGCRAGAHSGGPELLSVGAALLAATGARTVLASPYAVSDLAASCLLARLLPLLLDGEPPDAALGLALADLAAVQDAASLEAFLGKLQPEHAVWARPELLELAKRLGGLPEPILTLPDLAGWALIG
jgi:hypothetical protein